MQTLATAPPQMPSLASAYARIRHRRIALLCLLGLLLALSLLADVASGPAGLTLSQVIAGLADKQSLDAATQVILWDLRLPVALMAAVVGAALGLAGAEMQTSLGNPLASPMTLGISAAATLGAAVVLVLDPAIASHIGANQAVSLGAFICAAACALIVQGLARMLGGSSGAIVLFGIAMSFAINALVSVIEFVAEAGSLQQVVFWSMGSLSRADWPKLAIVSGVLGICLPWALRSAWAMTALCSGEEQARSLGIAVERLRLVTLLRASLLAAVAVAFVGAIGFIGLVAPHVARLLLGEDHRYFLPGAALSGALVLSLASIVCKNAVPGLVIPVGIVTALVGVPLFIALILVQRRSL
ncbi:iron ABC transporter permease [Uliginosibacterium sediminicola]|uniref:Iron ABC transporter permease n=1 Tax=Uliginosibacterium sediminicola TaxID=2024550 RepID=A0ABU9Z320_9RHOO